jgi:hypothetical protein
MLKKVIKDIIYCSVEDLKNGSVDNGFMLDGKDLLECETIEEGIEELKKFGLIKGDNVIIPKGFILNEINKFGGAVEYVFNEGKIQVDLALDNENKYLSKDIEKLAKIDTEYLLIATIANIIMKNHTNSIEDMGEALNLANEIYINGGWCELDNIIKKYLEER